jgi:hypothetical protein
MKTLLGLFPYVLFFLSLTLPAELRTLDATKGAVEEWMKDSRSLSKHSVAGSEVFDVEGFDAGLHVFRLLPAGYLIANADTRLPLVLAFSGNSELSLVDSDENTLRALLETYVGSIPDRLEALSMPRPMGDADPLPMEDVYVAPMLGTAWNQTNPYNTHLPVVAGALSGYDGRAPVGCVATAYSQILNFHRWPVRGWGGHSYSDSSGPVTGTHSVTFDTEYDWDNMLPGYSAFGSNPPEAAAAVSKLMWDLVVAKEANIEADGTSAVTLFLGQQLNRHHYMEVPSKPSSGAETSLQAELQAGYPAVVEIPGHAVVADGLDISGATTLYHIQYGWGGTNDGWFAASAIPGGGLTAVIVGIRPSLMPFATEGPVSAPANQSATLSRILPREREDELQALRLHQRETLSGTWNADLVGQPHIEAMDWNVVEDATRGSVYFAGRTGPATLLLNETFVPTASSTLSFWMKYRLAGTTLHVEVSNNGGQSYTSIFQRNNSSATPSWTQYSVPLSSYAGQTIHLRFFLSSGTYWTTGLNGAWLDSASITNTTWNQWTFWKQLSSFAVDRFSSVFTTVDEGNDFTTFVKTSPYSSMDWQIAAMNGGDGFYKEPGGQYSGISYHLSSTSTITPTANTRLVLYGRYKFSTDFMRVLASTNGTTWTELQSFTGSSPWTNLTVDLAAYAGQAIYLRLEYVVGSYYSDGGVWIDRVSLEEVTNPELEGQPLHRTLVTDLGLGEGTHTLAATAVDAGGTEHRLSPSFTLNLTAPETSRGTLHSWLVTYGGIAPAADDATFEAADLDDSDDPGFALWKHFLAGTIPGSPLAATPSFSDSTVTVSWNGQPGRSYRVLRTNDLSQPIAQWTPQGQTLTATELNQPLSFGDQPPAPGPWFYALDVSLTDP